MVRIAVLFHGFAEPIGPSNASARYWYRFLPVSRLEWTTLMVAARSGDQDAYRRLLSQLRPWLQRYFAGRLPAGMVEDAVQETLFAVHTKRHMFDATRPLGPWLSAIARFKWIDQLRAVKRMPTGTTLVEQAVGDHESAVTSATVLDRLLAELKPGQADAIRLVRLLGYSTEEASARTGQSVSLVKVNIHRGLKRMASRLGEIDAVE